MRRTLAPPPENPFNDPDPHSLLGRAVRWPFRFALLALALLAVAAYLLVVEPFSGDDD